MKLSMSFLVTRPLRPVPSSFEMSTPCSCAILRTRGLDLVRRSSSTLAVLPSCVDGVSAGGSGFASTGGGGGAGRVSTGGGGTGAVCGVTCCGCGGGCGDV